ncbi:MAG: LysM peptidoglycan-binding domain-containing protein [Bacteroidetes bacterium]|nr:LysM peptidoglycan-binding domain-containing protein [Bacteroidota bacterium]
MKRLFALLTTLSIVLISWSQPAQLIIQGETGKLYLEHTVTAKENWYSIGRLFNISPKEIAPFNGLTIKSPLDIGQQIKVPLTSDNFVQKTNKSSSETLVPVYHIIQEKEWMYHISTTYNKVPIDKLEKWNNISKDQAKAGMQLIVGYLKVKTDQSAFADMSNGAPIATLAPLNKDAAKATNTNPVAKEEKPVDKKAPASTPESSVTGNVASNENAALNTYSANHAAGGFFGNEFNGNKAATGQAGTFKSTSGWHDGKYYALMNNVAVGTIVKITSVSTNKSVYAKVLGQLPDMKESMGLAIRVSNAAAAELGTGEGKFPVDIKY